MHLFEQSNKERACSLRLWKDNRAGKTETRQALDMATTGRRASLTHPSRICLPPFMRLFGSHGVTHSTREQRSPRSGGWGEGQNTPAGPGSAAQALDAVELD